MNEFMKRAVELAAKNVREGGEPFGAVLVKDGVAVAEGANELHTTYDISGHAEMVVIRKIQQEIKTHDLSDYTMYASGEPCLMCLTAMYMAGIKKTYYCATLQDAADIGLSSGVTMYEDLEKPGIERDLPIEHMPLEDGQEDPMKLWKDRT